APSQPLYRGQGQVREDMLHVPGVNRVLPSDLLGQVPPRGPVGRSVGDLGTGTGRRHARSIALAPRAGTSGAACSGSPTGRSTRRGTSGWRTTGETLTPASARPASPSRPIAAATA